MRNFLKVLLVLIIIFGLVSYIDYFMVKKKNVVPKISIKKEYKDSEMIVYNSLFYKVWYCTKDKSIIIGSYGEDDAVCPLTYEFVDEYYTNASNYKISKSDLSIISYNNIYTREMIDIMKSKEEVDNAVYVSLTFMKLSPKIIETSIKLDEGISIALYPTYNENENKWEYKDNIDNYYCYKKVDGLEYNSKYINGKCEELKLITIEDKWCNLYKNSTLVYNEEIKNEYCK